MVENYSRGHVPLVNLGKLALESSRSQADLNLWYIRRTYPLSWVIHYKIVMDPQDSQHVFCQQLPYVCSTFGNSRTSEHKRFGAW